MFFSCIYMHWLSLMALYFGVLLAFCTLSAVTGFSLIHLLGFGQAFSERPYTRMFVALLAGNVVLCTCYAITMTGFKTVSLVGLVAILLFIYEADKKRIPATAKENGFKRKITHWKGYLILPVVLLFFFLANASMYIRVDEGVANHFPFYVQNLDLVGYGNYVTMLNVTRQENYNGFVANYFDGDFHGLSPYHFYELWIAAFIAKIFHIQPVAAYWLITYPVFYLLTWLGMLSFGEYHRPVTIHTQGLALPLLLVGGIYFPVYNLLPYLGDVYYLHNNFVLTYGLIEPFLLAVLLLYLQRLYVPALLVLFYIPVTSIATLPGIYGGFLLCLLLCLLFVKSKAIRQGATRSAAYLLLLLLSFGILYFMLGTKNKAVSSVGDFLPVFAFSAFENKSAAALFILKKLIVVYGLYVFKSVVAYLPFGLVAWSIWKHKKLKTLPGQHRPLLLFVICVFFASLSATFLMIIHPDATQLFRNISFPVINLFIACTMMYALRTIRVNRWIKIGLLLLLVYQFGFSTWFRYEQVAQSQMYSERYMREIACIAPTLIKNRMGAFIYSKDFYSDDHIFSKVPRHNIPAGYLASMPQFYSVVNLGIMEMPLSSKPEQRVLEERYLQNAEFYRFVERQKQQQVFESVSQSQVDFIRRHRISYLIAGKGVRLDQKLQQLVVRQWEDKKSGERFLLLK